MLYYKPNLSSSKESRFTGGEKYRFEDNAAETILGQD
jgi:hypothetical protein